MPISVVVARQEEKHMISLREVTEAVSTQGLSIGHACSTSENMCSQLALKVLGVSNNKYSDTPQKKVFSMWKAILASADRKEPMKRKADKVGTTTGYSGHYYDAAYPPRSQMADRTPRRVQIRRYIEICPRF